MIKYKYSLYTHKNDNYKCTFFSSLKYETFTKRIPPFYKKKIQIYINIVSEDTELLIAVFEKQGFFHFIIHLVIIILIQLKFLEQKGVEKPLSKHF